MQKNLWIGGKTLQGGGGVDKVQTQEGSLIRQQSTMREKNLKTTVSYWCWIIGFERGPIELNSTKSEQLLCKCHKKIRQTVANIYNAKMSLNRGGLSHLKKKPFFCLKSWHIRLHNVWVLRRSQQILRMKPHATAVAFIAYISKGVFAVAAQIHAKSVLLRRVFVRSCTW